MSTDNDLNGQLSFDANAATSFLQSFDPIGYHNLVSIIPDGGPLHAKTFPPGSWPALAAWAEAENAKGRNVYFTVNEVRPDTPDKKPSKADIAAIRAVYVDVDPEKNKPIADEQARLRALAASAARSAYPPTFAINSGGGVQLFWALAEKLPAADARTWAEDQSAGLARLLEGDATQNIDRVMRLPGTVNFPKTEKRARGQKETRAVLLSSSQRRYSQPELAAWVRPERGAKANSISSDQEAEAIALIDMQEIQSADIFADLPSTLRVKFLDACKRDDALRALWAGDKTGHGSDASGSGFRASLAVRLARTRDFTLQEFGQLTWVWPHAVTAGKDRDTSVTPREIARCWLNLAERTSMSPEDWFDPIEDEEPSPFDFQDRTLENRPDHTANRFKFLSYSDAIEQAATEDSKPLVKGLLDQGAMSVLYGDSNSGKTFVALDLAFHVWQGRPYAGMKVSQGGVVYVAAEGGKGIKRRLRALHVEKGPVNDDGRFNVLPASINLLDPSCDLPGFVAAIRALDASPSLIVIDTLARAIAGGDENASTDMGSFVRCVDALRAATGAHVMVIHHTGKDKAKGARGHSSLRAATDTELEVERGDAGGTSGGTVTATKQREMEAGVGLAFSLRSVPLGFDADGDLITSAVALVGSQGAADAPVVTREASGNEGAVLDTLSFLHSTDAASGEGFTVGDVFAALGEAGYKGRGGKDGVRTMLSRLKNKGHVVQLKPGKWALKAHISITRCIVSPHFSMASEQPIILEEAKQSETRAKQNVFG